MPATSPLTANPAMHRALRIKPRKAGDFERVRWAWRVTSPVRVLWPGIRRAEGKEKGKGVVARRGLEEAQSEAAGR